MKRFRSLVIALILLAPATARAEAAADAETIAAIEAVAFDYVDGQLEGDAERVARSLHPDLAKRSVRRDAAVKDETFPLRRMGKDELVALTRQGVIKTPREQWSRLVKVLDVTGHSAVVRVETPWFVDYFHMGRFGSRWLIVNALWEPKRRNSAD